MFMDVAFLVHFLDVPFLFLPSLILLFGTAGLNLLIAIMLFLSQIYINDDFKQWIRLNSRVATLFTILSIFHIEVLKVLTSNFLHSETFNAPISNSARKWLSITGLFLVVVEDVPQFVILVSTAFQGSRKNFYVKIINNVVCELYKPINRSNTQNIQKPILSRSVIKWIPYSQIADLKRIAEGGFGIIYKAKYLGEIPKVKDNSNVSNIEYSKNETVAVKRFINSKDISKYFLNELSWNKKKLRILWNILNGLETIHNKELIHRDVHSGNILFVEQNDYRYQWQIGDLGLSQPANNTSLNNEIYGVIPYIAPEIFNGAPFSKKSDVYIIRQTVGSWLYRKKNDDLFDQAEKKRVKLMNLKKLGPKLIEKHPNAIYTSRALSSLISRPLNLSANSFNGALDFNEFCINFYLLTSEYISKEYEFDMDTRGLLAINAQPSNVMSTENSSKKRSIKELEAKTQVY
ncbi:15812_t:CDS:2, partial [Funneliformis geosporum]